jgi:prepilin-type N-terminal cleavage/methylation domain-containing protein
VSGRLRNLLARLRRRAANDDGFGLVELVIAMTILTVAVGALLGVFVNSALSLQRAGERGTALALADKQMEIYRRLSFTGARIDGSLIPATGTYVTANSSDSTIPPSTNQAVGGANDDDACPGDPAEACLPVQTVTGPDNRQYRIDTYVHYVNGLDDDAASTILAPASGLTLKRVTVVVRKVTTGAILARGSSAFQGP